PWHHRALEPDLVPAPPAGASHPWPMMLRLGAVCTIAAMVAAAVVFLLNPKQTAHKIAQAIAAAPASVADDAAPSAIESSHDVPAGAPVITVETSAVETSAGVTTPPAPGQVVAAAGAPQPAHGQAVAAPPPQQEQPPAPPPPPHQPSS